MHQHEQQCNFHTRVQRIHYTVILVSGVMTYYGQMYLRLSQSTFIID